MGSDMRPPPIQRDNTLTRAYDAIRAQSRTGGSTGLRSTVLPPPPTPEEMEAMRQIEEDTWGPAEIPPEPASFSPEAAPPAGSRSSVEAHRPLTGFIAVDLVRGQVVGDNGETFPLTEPEIKQLLASCVNIAQRSMEQRLLAIAEASGLEVVRRGTDAGMPEVPSPETKDQVQTRPKRERRKAKDL